MAASAGLETTFSGRAANGGGSYICYSFALIVLPLLALMAAGKKVAAVGEKRKKKQAVARAKKSFAKTLRKPKQPSIRGPYNQWDEYAMEEALTELAECADAKNSELEFNVKRTAEKYQLPRKTLARYFYKPGYFDSRKEAANNKRILTSEEEDDVVECILNQHSSGMALNHAQVKWVIMEIIKRIPGKAETKTGKAWIQNRRPSYTWYREFLKRHSDRISSRVCENLDPKRWKVTYNDVKSLYTIMEKLQENYPNLPARNICNLDETNLTPERRKSRVLAAKGARRSHTLCNEARFSMTALPVVFADGSEMPPHFIVKGQRRPKWWGGKEFCIDFIGTEFEQATLSVQKNGWMDSEIFLAWFTEKFLPFTSDRRSAKTPVILILDNFSGHVHPATLRVARENNVIMVGLPPHSTHITQPLDVTLMKPLKDYWKSVVETLQVENPWDIYKEQDVIRLLCQPNPIIGARPDHPAGFWSPWSKTFTRKNVKTAFYSTGLWPVDFEKVQDLVYDLTKDEDAPAPAQSSVASANTTYAAAARDEPSTTNRTAAQRSSVSSKTLLPLVSDAIDQRENELEQKLLRQQREIEKVQQQLETLRRKRGVLQEWSMNASTICQSVGNQAPVKRTRIDGRGRTEALVLNTVEQIAIVEAKKRLREKKRDMKQAIATAKKDNRAALSTLNSLVKELLKAVAEVDKQCQNAANNEGKAKVSQDKRSAVAASAQAQKAAEKARTVNHIAEGKVSTVSEALHTCLKKEAALKEAEEELKKLEDAAKGAQEQEEDFEEEEEEEEEDSAPAPENAAKKYEAAIDSVEHAKQVVKLAEEHADQAAIYALHAAAKEAWRKAAAIATRVALRNTGLGRGRGRGRGRGSRGQDAAETSNLPVATAP